MKTRVIVEIETPDLPEIYPEEGQTADDFKGKEEELKKHREEFARDLHETTVRKAKDYFDDDIFEDHLLDDICMDELSVEGWETFDDYGIKITVSEDETPKV